MLFRTGTIRQYASTNTCILATYIISCVAKQPTIVWREGVVSSVETQHRHLQSVHLVVDTCVTVIVLPLLIPEHWRREAVIKLSDGGALQQNQLYSLHRNVRLHTLESSCSTTEPVI